MRAIRLSIPRQIASQRERQSPGVFVAGRGARNVACKPVPRPHDWLEYVNRPQTEAEVERLRESLRCGRPFGASSWMLKTARQLGLEASLRPRGRPRKLASDQSTNCRFSRTMTRNNLRCPLFRGLCRPGQPAQVPCLPARRSTFQGPDTVALAQGHPPCVRRRRKATAECHSGKEMNENRACCAT